MSRNQLIDAYQTGRINRRVFVRGMVGLGMSLSMATALADKVRASAAAPSGRKFIANAQDDSYDTYEPATGGVTTTTTTTLPNTGVAEGSKSQAGLAKSLTILGAGAAIVAGALRRKKDPEASEQ